MWGACIPGLILITAGTICVMSGPHEDSVSQLTVNTPCTPRGVVRLLFSSHGVVSQSQSSTPLSANHRAAPCCQPITEQHPVVSQSQSSTRCQPITEQHPGYCSLHIHHQHLLWLLHVLGPIVYGVSVSSTGPKGAMYALM